MLENRAVIDEFVDRDSVKGSFEFLCEDLDHDEMALAIDVVVQSRAQFVIDAVLSELVARKRALLTQRTTIEDEARELTSQVNEINRVMGFSHTDEREGLDQRAKDRSKWFDSKIKEPQFMRDIEENEPSFVLWFQLAGIHRKPVLTPWVHDHYDELREKYGKHVGNFERATNCLARASVETWTSDGVGEVIISDEDSIEVGIVIDNPYQFINRALCITNFGLKSAVALMCIADMQRAERQARQH